MRPDVLARNERKRCETDLTEFPMCEHSRTMCQRAFIAVSCSGNTRWGKGKTQLDSHRLQNPSSAPSAHEPWAKRNVLVPQRSVASGKVAVWWEGELPEPLCVWPARQTVFKARLITLSTCNQTLKPLESTQAVTHTALVDGTRSTARLLGVSRWQIQQMPWTLSLKQVIPPLRRL